MQAFSAFFMKFCLALNSYKSGKYKKMNKNKNKKEKFRIHNRMNQRTSLFGLTESSKSPASIERSNT